MSAASTSCCNRYGLLVGRPSSRQCRWCDVTDLVDKLVLDKNGKSRNNNYLHTVLNSMISLCTKYYQNWSISVEDIASQSSVIFGIQPNWRDPISGVHVSTGSAETLVSRSGIRNNLLLEYSLSNISAKKYENRLMCIEVSVLHQCCFFETQCSYLIGVRCRWLAYCPADATTILLSLLLY